ncbi:MAG: asparagine synthase (glutamine-hydrolyzing) [Anaerolineaceae bacterium]|nr:asparagine synthase (glutamine-hydrolyzing) [Anaerolineaceae bacterium]
MCGITGFWDPRRGSDGAALHDTVHRMALTISHRGPDDHGAWTDAETGLALGFRRLSIVDLSPTGHQPMSSTDGRYVIVFNGEVYNFLELRAELTALGHSFRGTSDTEVMLAAICQWGLTAAVKRFNGMFAFALWDRAERHLHLVRDRLGIKPLYYGWSGGVFLFGSELKPLRAHPAFQAGIDRDVLSLFLRFAYVSAPFSIYQGIHKQPPGTILTLTADHLHEEAHIETYWSARQVAEDGVRQGYTGSEEEARQELDALLRDGIQKRMLADVPLGAFLSGGVDSSTVVALMQAQSSQPVKTFSIGFHEAGYDEAQYARQVAAHLGTEHTELYLSPRAMLDVVPHLPRLYDEPFADASQIPTYLVSQLARRHVTVSLSGDGGDELFAGYNRYTWTDRIWNRVGGLPPFGRRTLRGLLSILPPEGWQTLARRLGPLAPRQPLLADKVQKLGDVLGVDSPQEVYRQLVSQWKQPEQVVLRTHEPLTLLNDPSAWANVPDFAHWMMFMDLVTYLPDDILVKVDRASMGVSLEGRVPLLDDHRVVEFAWRLPMSYKLRGGQSKWLLRQVLYQYVPPALIERPKMGFAIPIDAWLREPLRDWAESYLAEDRLRREGFFDPAPIRRKWDEHLNGRRNWQYPLWAVLMFQTWLEA